MAGQTRTGSALDGGGANGGSRSFAIARQTAGSHSPARDDGSSGASGMTAGLAGPSAAFDFASLANALPSAPSSGTSGSGHYSHGHSASMSAIPPKGLLSPTPQQAASPSGHAHSRSVSHSRPPSHNGAGVSTEPPLPATTTSSSSASSVAQGLAPGTPDVFDGSVRQGTCKFFNSQKGYGFINDARAHELNGEEGPSSSFRAR